MLSLKLSFYYFRLLLTQKQKKSILVLPSFGAFGGTKTYFFYLIEFFHRKKYSIHVILTKRQCDADVIELKAKYPFTIHELDFNIIPTAFTGTIFYKRNQEYFIYHLKELIYFWKHLIKLRCNHLLISEAFPEQLLSLMVSPVKVRYVLHTVATHPMDGLKRKFLAFSLSKNRQIITVSNYAKEKILKNWTNCFHPEFIRRIYNFYQPRNQVIQSTSPVIKSVLTIGTVALYKNPFFWIEVCKAVVLKYNNEPVEFIWAGDGELFESCKASVIDFHPIKFIGYQKNTEQLYQDCTVYFQPSILESQGIAVLGAMYFEKPCVVSNKQGLPESVMNDKTGFIVPIEQPHDSVTAILYLLNKPAKGIEFGKAGKERAAANFGKNKWEAEMSELFN